ncbi:prolyl-tRNA synthetase domain protein [Mycobacterium xenopi 3993]|nr:prolyl-tRNA synthetase domain protein [Mycobacterium xenopi 3993]
MITRMSELFLRTLREDPADAEVPSHKLLIRAGYIRPVGPACTAGCRSGCGCCAKSSASSAKR